MTNRKDKTAGSGRAASAKDGEMNITRNKGAYERLSPTILRHLIEDEPAREIRIVESPDRIIHADIR